MHSLMYSKSHAPIALLATALAMLPACSLAGEYVLERGAGAPVCTEFAKNLRKVSVDPVREMNTCPIPIDSSLPDLQAPDWVNLKENPPPTPDGIDLFAKIDRFLWQRDANPVDVIPASEWQQWRGTKSQLRAAFISYSRQRERYYSEPAAILAYATLDIDNDGQPDNVYRDNHSCQYQGVGALLLVLTGNYADIDRDKTERILAHARRPAGAPYFRPRRPDERGVRRVNGRFIDIVPVSNQSRSTVYGAFLFRGKTFITISGLAPSWEPREQRTLHIQLHEPKGSSEVCTFRFNE